MSDIAEEVAEVVRSAVGLEPGLRVRTFPSGATAIEVHGIDLTIVIDGTADGKWGVSADPDHADGFGGYEQIFPSLADATAAARMLLTGQALPTPTEPE